MTNRSDHDDDIREYLKVSAEPIEILFITQQSARGKRTSILA